MSNAGIKTFAYSFVFSLFAIFLVNKAVGHAPSEKEPQIPHNNISLFLKSEVLPHGAPSTPVRKIALIKDIPQETNVPQPRRETKPEKKDFPVVAEEPVVKQVRAENPAKKERLIAALEKTKLPPIKQETKKKVHSKAVTEPVAQDNKDKHAPENLVIAQNDVSPASEAHSLPAEPGEKPDTEETLLIPLQKVRNTAFVSNEKVQINGTGADKQVAMLDLKQSLKNVVEDAEPVTAGAEKENEENNPAEISGWQPMAEKKGETSPVRAGNSLYDVMQVEVQKPAENNSAALAEAPKEDSHSEKNTTEESKPEDKWIAAKGTKFPVNQNVLEQDYYKQAEDTDKITAVLSGESASKDKKEVKVAGEVVQNILIPIPDDIINNKNLMPQLVSDPENMKLEEDLIQKERLQAAEEEGEVPFIAEKKEQTQAEHKDGKSGLLSSISSLFNGQGSSEGSSTGAGSHNSKANSSEQSGQGKILPTEIRLSFQPNRAEISGKTLNWIQAFANKAQEDDYNILEIRIDGTSSFELQQKRLNLLYNILTNLGLEYKKVDTVFTNREPNSFVLRVVNRGDRKEDVMSPVRSMYYKRW